MPQAKSSKIIIALSVSLLIAAGVIVACSGASVQAYGLPVFAICGALAFVINWLVYVPSNLAKTEKFYDLTGGITYITVVITALLLSPNIDARAALAAALVLIWAIRLATFLFRRISKDGKDGRFDEIKQNPLRFFLTWTLQGLWVLLTAACALAIITTQFREPIGFVAIVGAGIWLFGFAIEVIADHQKSVFRADSSNEGQFIRSGLWAWSRHPNYFGEIMLWTGMAIIALPILQGWQIVAMISPVFVTLLLTKVSGIPLLEARADERWGDDAAYQQYKANTPVLIPKPPTH